MAVVSNLKINERRNAERPNLRVTKIGIGKIDLWQRENMRIGEIASRAEYRSFLAKFWFSGLKKF